MGLSSLPANSLCHAMSIQFRQEGSKDCLPIFLFSPLSGKGYCSSVISWFLLVPARVSGLSPYFPAFSPNSSGAEWGSQFFQEIFFVPDFLVPGRVPGLPVFCFIIIYWFLLVLVRVPGLVSPVF